MHVHVQVDTQQFPGQPPAMRQRADRTRSLLWRNTGVPLPTQSAWQEFISLAAVTGGLHPRLEEG
jgi:hypothetical protein